MNYYSIKSMTGGCAIVATSLDDAAVFIAVSNAIRGRFILCNICEVTDEMIENAIDFDEYIKYLELKHDLNNNVALLSNEEQLIYNSLL